MLIGVDSVDALVPVGEIKKSAIKSFTRVTGKCSISFEAGNIQLPERPA